MKTHLGVTAVLVVIVLWQFTTIRTLNQQIASLTLMPGTAQVHIAATPTAQDKLLGNAVGQYEPVVGRRLGAHLKEYAGRKVEFEADVGVLGIDISKENYQLKIGLDTSGTYAIQNVDVVVLGDSPLYDQLVDINPVFQDHLLIRGTVKWYRNSEEQYIEPDQLVVTPKRR